MIETVDVVIPARNEEANIRHILSVLHASEHVQRIVVIVDPDTRDDTYEIASSLASRVLYSSLPGKGQCVSFGLEFVNNHRVVLCDADLEGLEEMHLERLANPSHGYSQVICVPEIPDNYWVSVSTLNAWPWVSGLRSVPLVTIKHLDLHGYLTEVQINTAVQAVGGRTDLVYCKGLRSPFRMSEQRIREMERDRAWGITHGILTDKSATG